MKLTLINKKPEVADVNSFIFASEQPISWKAGQFMRYVIDNPNPDDRRNYRFFSIASAPFEKNVMITTRFVPGGGSTFKKDLLSLNIGDSIEATGPGGDFIISEELLEATPNQSFVFIAGGIGITPFHSIILDLDNRQKPININLLYANRDADFIYKNQLEEIAKRHPEFKVQYFIEPNRIDQQALQLAINNNPSATFYVSGPEPMVEVFEKILYELGVDKEKVKRDYFPGYTGL